MYWFIYDTSTGQILERHRSNVSKWETTEGQSSVSFDETDTTAQDAINNPSHYTVVNNKLISTVTNAQLLAEAQASAIAAIQGGYEETVNAGFQATISGASYTFGWQQMDQMHLMQVQQAVDKGIDTFPMPYADINGNTVSIPDQTTLDELDVAANSFAWAQIKQLRTLVAEAKATTTVAQAQAVTWAPASY